MSPGSRRDLAATAAVVFATVVLYLLPQLTAWQHGWHGVLDQYFDDLYYDALIAETARTGRIRFDASAGSDPTLQAFPPSAPIRAAALVGRLAGRAPDAQAITVRAFQAVAFALTLLGLARVLGACWTWGALIVGLALFDPFAPFQKPGLGLSAGLLGHGPPGGYYGHLWSRPVSPAGVALPALLGLAATTVACSRPSARRAFGAGLLVGLAAYSAAFVTLPLAAGASVATIALFRTGGAAVAATYLGVAAAVALPAAVQNVSLALNPEFTQFALRFGLRRGPNLESLRVAGTWLTLGLTALVGWQTRKRLRVWGPGLATAVAGCALSMQSLVTGRDFQDFHYLYLPSMVMPPMLAAWISGLASGGAARIWNRLAIVWAVYAAATWLSTARIQQRAAVAAITRPSDRAAERSGSPALTWLAANLEPGQPVVAPANWSWSVVFRTGARPLVDYGAVATLVPDSILFLRWVAEWKAYRLSPDQVKDSIEAAMVQQLPWWPFGFPDSAVRRRLNLPDFRPSQLQPLIRAWTQWYAAAKARAPVRPAAAVVPSGQGFDPEAVGWAAADTAYRTPDGAWLILRPAQPHSSAPPPAR